MTEIAKDYQHLFVGTKKKISLPDMKFLNFLMDQIFFLSEQNRTQVYFDI